jgi:hypothetical protein
MGTERRKSEAAPVPLAVTVLTPRQVAALTNRHEGTVTAALRSGELRGKQRIERGSWRILRSDAIAWAVGDMGAAA